MTGFVNTLQNTTQKRAGYKEAQNTTNEGGGQKKNEPFVAGGYENHMDAVTNRTAICPSRKAARVGT